MINNVKDYIKWYTNTISTSLNSIDEDTLYEIEDTIFKAYLDQRTVFVCGNGGSAAIAEHFVCDHLKGISSDTSINPKIMSLSSNIPLITALGNDYGYDQIYSTQLEYYGKEKDVLIVISSSGNSPNIVNAIRTAKEKNITSIALVGFDGGTAKEIADICIHIEQNNYGICEDVHQNIMHVIAQFIRQKFTYKNNLKL